MSRFRPEDALSSLAAEVGAAPVVGWPAGAPAQDYTRSPAAARVGRLAAAEGLFCFHFEQRAALELPDHWVEPGRQDEAAPSVWHNGVLAERKYQSFRHDLMVASFHPGHRGKWTTHELCHALVGFAWRPDASPLFHATAARLAELLPVVLYYYLDEVRLSRCPDHAGGGALFRAYCPQCEACAAFRPLDPSIDRRAIEDALGYLDGELAACSRTLRLGRPISYRQGSLDLCSDGLAYARAHRWRLTSEAFHTWADMFTVAGLHTSLASLQARIEEVAGAILHGRSLAPRQGCSWAAQDLAMRLLQVREETDGDAASGLLQLAQRLADGAEIPPLLADYDALAEAFVLPPRELIAAVGYPLTAGDGRSQATVRDGLTSAVPLTMQLLATAGVDPVKAFNAEAPPRRAPLGVRFASWLDRRYPGAAAELAQFETAVLTCSADALAAALGAGVEGEAALANGFEVLKAGRDVVAVAERVAAGLPGVMLVHGAVTIADEVLEPSALVVGRNSSGELLIVTVEPEVADALKQANFDAIPPAELKSLRELGVVVSTRWSLTG